MKKLSWFVAVLITAGSLVAIAGDADKKNEVELKGKIGCAHCTYHKGTECGVGLKTADGKIYVLDKASDELMKARFKGGELKVKGTVTEKDGVLYVSASKAELVK